MDTVDTELNMLYPAAFQAVLFDKENLAPNDDWQDLAWQALTAAYFTRERKRASGGDMSITLPLLRVVVQRQRRSRYRKANCIRGGHQSDRFYHPKPQHISLERFKIDW